MSAPVAALAPPERAAVTVGALTAAGRGDELAAAAAGLLLEGVAVADLREAAYVASLFAGFPAGVAALVALADLPAGAGEAAHHLDPAPEERAALLARGEALFRAIHHDRADRQLAMLGRIHPDFAETVLAEAYGRVLARDFLPLPVRELVGAAVLVVRGLLPQLKAHLLACRDAGVSRAVAEAAVRLAGELGKVDPEGALAVVRGLQERAPGG